MPRKSLKQLIQIPNHANHPVFTCYRNTCNPAPTDFWAYPVHCRCCICRFGSEVDVQPCSLFEERICMQWLLVDMAHGCHQDRLLPPHYLKT
ncbi:hypothetical protein DUNSADRAFT_7985 [Dunaliella salina]|uniref:Encoded protein n=1 Tax=Dunaliella salina TaxID=3046 RepID=A0ABQ7GK90_DUNSA|nr:hypothetical protein DUNSADRAFT_7985 [Dunaliella salina]|eukprot:KAF5835041.1 hypothetical protein DUNSADRAFT_7985 [Dunaliella salina]